MNKNKIKLYHYSGYNFKGKIKTSYFAINSYTSGDLKTCRIKRTFCYLQGNPLEYRFKNTPYLYIAEIDKTKLYDLRIDKKNLINKSIRGGIVSIYNLLTEIIRQGYSGIIYEAGGIDIVAILQDLKITQKLKRG